MNLADENSPESPFPLDFQWNDPRSFTLCPAIKHNRIKFGSHTNNKNYHVGVRD